MVDANRVSGLRLLCNVQKAPIMSTKHPDTGTDFVLFFARRAQIMFDRARYSMEKARAHGGDCRAKHIKRARMQNRIAVQLLKGARRYLSDY